MNELNLESLVSIFSFNSVRDLRNISLINKRFNYCINNSGLTELLWQRKLLSDFDITNEQESKEYYITIYTHICDIKNDDSYVFTHCRTEEIIIKNDMLMTACKTGFMEIVKILLSKKCPIYSDCLRTASLYGNFDIVKLLLEHDSTVDIYATRSASMKGYTEILIFLLNSGFPFDSLCIKLAAEYGEYKCIEILLKVGCPVDKECIDIAAENGHYNCVKILLENNCPFDNETFKVSYKYREIYELLVSYLKNDEN